MPQSSCNMTAVYTINTWSNFKRSFKLVIKYIPFYNTSEHLNPDAYSSNCVHISERPTLELKIMMIHINDI